jgi:hypothetical protein
LPAIAVRQNQDLHIVRSHKAAEHSAAFHTIFSQKQSNFSKILDKSLCFRYKIISFVVEPFSDRHDGLPKCSDIVITDMKEKKEL